MSKIPEIWLEELITMEEILKNSRSKKSYRKIVKEYANIYKIEEKTARLFVKLILPEMVRLNIIKKVTICTGINGSYKWVQNGTFDTLDPEYQLIRKSFFERQEYIPSDDFMNYLYGNPNL